MTTFSSIGRSLPRPDGGEKVTGLTRYAGDVRLPGMLHARLVLSPHAHARILRIDAKDAAALPGVVGVFGGRDLPIPSPDPADRNRCPLALDRALFTGHPVAAVVALTEAAAEDAAALVRVEYEELPAAIDPLEAMKPDAPLVGERRGGDEAALGMHGAAGAGQALQEPTPPNVASTAHFTRGDVASGFRDADVVIEKSYRTAMVHQGYLEPRAAIASVDALGNVTVWATTQALFYTRSEVAEALGLPEHRVRVIATPLGGGFGGKFVLLEPLAAALALAIRRPVSLVLTRTEEFLATTPARRWTRWRRPSGWTRWSCGCAMPSRRVSPWPMAGHGRGSACASVWPRSSSSETGVPTRRSARPTGVSAEAWASPWAAGWAASSPPAPCAGSTPTARSASSWAR